MMIKKCFTIFILIFFLLSNSVMATEIDIGYWNNYNDKYLLEYLSLLYKNNQDLKIAKLNSLQAQDNIKMQFANQLPYLGFQGSYNWDIRSSQMQFGDIVRPTYSQYNFLLPISMSYEIDVWGQNYLKTKSVKLLKEIVLQDERSSYISITSNFASDYYNFIKIKQLLKNMQKIRELELEIVDKIDKKYVNGLAPITDVIVEKQELAKIEIDINVLEKDLQIIKEALKVQLGDRQLSDFNSLAYDDIKIFDIPSEIASDCIKNRPDVIKTEFYIKKIGLDIKVARREFLPKFVLFGDVGFNAYSFSNMFNSNTFLSSLGILPKFDIFTGGYKFANLSFKKHEYKKALQYYEKTVLTSLQEVNNSLLSSKTCKNNYEKKYNNILLEREKFRLKQRQFEIGSISEFDVLVSQKHMLKLEQELINEKVNYIISTINIYKALGGVDYLSADKL